MEELAELLREEFSMTSSNPFALMETCEVKSENEKICWPLGNAGNGAGSCAGVAVRLNFITH